jgi:hypothetical protein
MASPFGRLAGRTSPPVVLDRAVKIATVACRCRTAGTVRLVLEPRERSLLLGFLGWTVFVWVNRILNVLRDGEGVGALVLPALVVVSTGLFVVGMLRARAASWTVDRMGGHLLRVLPTLTLLAWAFRGVAITLADHDTAFVAVHLALAVVSVVLAVLVWRCLPSTAVEAFAEHAPPA